MCLPLCCLCEESRSFGMSSNMNTQSSNWNSGISTVNHNYIENRVKNYSIIVQKSVNGNI